MSTDPTFPRFSVASGSGGGVIGAVRDALMTTPGLTSSVGANVYPGMAPPGTPLPLIVLTHVSKSISDSLTQADLAANYRLDVWREVIQVAVYAEGYEAARVMGDRAHARLSRQVFTVDCVQVTLYPDSQTFRMDPKRSETGSDVWSAVYRYHTFTADLIPVIETVAVF